MPPGLICASCPNVTLEAEPFTLVCAGGHKGGVDALVSELANGTMGRELPSIANWADVLVALFIWFSSVNIIPNFNLTKTRTRFFVHNHPSFQRYDP